MYTSNNMQEKTSQQQYEKDLRAQAYKRGFTACLVLVVLPISIVSILLINKLISLL